jgi:heme exporter protein CcmD
MSICQFLRMGGYAAFVWPSYALAVLVILINILSARRSLHEGQRAARRRFESGDGSGRP